MKTEKNYNAAGEVERDLNVRKWNHPDVVGLEVKWCLKKVGPNEQCVTISKEKCCTTCLEF